MALSNNPDHTDRHGPGLCYVKHVVEQGLVLVRSEQVELLEDEDYPLARGRISGVTPVTVERGEEEEEVLGEGPKDPVPHHVLQVELLVPERHPVVSLHVTGQLDDHGVLLPARGGGGPAENLPHQGGLAHSPWAQHEQRVTLALE